MQPPAGVHICLSVLLALLASCSALPDDRPTLRSITARAEVRPRLVLSAATASRLADDSIDVYATDLAPEQLEGTPLADAAGHLLHIHLFLVPTGGRTPIDPEASSASIRWIIVAGGEVGVYGGGGLVVPQGGEVLGSRRIYEIRQATLDLLRRTPGFRDRLGPATLTGSVRAQTDPSLAARIAAAIDRAAARARPEPGDE